MAQRTKQAQFPPTKAQCEQWEMLFPMLDSVLSELQILSKTKPNDALNEFKAKSLNKILRKSLDLLSHEPTAEFLDLLDEDLLPSNSDVVLMIVQFKSALEQFRTKHYGYNGVTNVWFTSD